MRDYWLHLTDFWQTPRSRVIYARCFSWETVKRIHISVRLYMYYTCQDGYDSGLFLQMFYNTI